MPAGPEAKPQPASGRHLLPNAKMAEFHRCDQRQILLSKKNVFFFLIKQILKVKLKIKIAVFESFRFVSSNFKSEITHCEIQKFNN